MAQTRMGNPGSTKLMPAPTVIVVRIPDADEVAITGDFNNWSEEGILMTRGKAGEFRSVLQLDPGQYQYRLIVDGVWRDNPDSPRRVANPYGGENCVLEVPSR